MNQSQFEAAVFATRTLLENEAGQRAVMAKRNQDDPTCSEHLSWMLAQALGFYGAEQKIEKANRWLGFVQGVLAAKGVSLHILKQANMPAGETFDPERV